MSRAVSGATAYRGQAQGRRASHNMNGYPQKGNGSPWVHTGDMDPDADADAEGEVDADGEAEVDADGEAEGARDGEPMVVDDDGEGGIVDVMVVLGGDGPRGRWEAPSGTYQVLSPDTIFHFLFTAHRRRVEIVFPFRCKDRSSRPLPSAAMIRVYLAGPSIHFSLLSLGLQDWLPISLRRFRIADITSDCRERFAWSWGTHVALPYVYADIYKCHLLSSIVDCYIERRHIGPCICSLVSLEIPHNAGLGSWGLKLYEGYFICAHI